MVTATPEAPSTKRVITKEDILKLLIRRMINGGNYLFYLPHLNREYVLGTVGDRGGGKSGSDAVISVVDFMLRGKPVWSNMDIAVDIEVSDELAMEAGLNSGGIVHYESLPIEKDKLLKLDDTYRHGCLVIEEINVQFSNVRRFMSNTNIDSNELYQQLRKFETTLIYNVIDEMFIDPQLRALTDIFIRTYDTAFDQDSMMRKKQAGVDFCWRVYPYSGYLNGEQGKTKNGNPSSKCFFKFMPWRGIYNDKQHQEHGVYSLNKRERERLAKTGLLVDDSEALKRAKEEYDFKWADIDNTVIELANNGEKEIERYELFELAGIDTEFENEADEHFKRELHLRPRWSGGVKFYCFPPRLFERRERECGAARN